MNTSQQNYEPPVSPPGKAGQPDEDKSIPEFLLSPVPTCVVELVLDAVQQTRPSKTETELLADGQCEV